MNENQGNIAAATTLDIITAAKETTVISNNNEDSADGAPATGFFSWQAKNGQEWWKLKQEPTNVHDEEEGQFVNDGIKDNSTEPLQQEAATSAVLQEGPPVSGVEEESKETAPGNAAPSGGLPPPNQEKGTEIDDSDDSNRESIQKYQMVRYLVIFVGTFAVVFFGVFLALVFLTDLFQSGGASSSDHTETTGTLELPVMITSSPTSANWCSQWGCGTLSPTATTLSPIAPGATSPPTVSPSATPSAYPSTTPTISPTNVPSTSPTATPTKAPTTSPTNVPSTLPTATPSATPTSAPTNLPTTAGPTQQPSLSPTNTPTVAPTTSKPTFAPTTLSPTMAPVTSAPTKTIDVINSPLFSYLTVLGTPAEILKDLNTPQGKAFYWLMQPDVAQMNVFRVPQRFALVALDFALHGNDANVDGWREVDTDICNWQGVTCDMYQEVTGIKWSNQGLTGTMVPEIRYLEKLERVDLAENAIEGTLDVFWDLPKLTHLYLFSNKLSGTIPADRAAPAGLKKVFLGHNQLTGALPLTLMSSRSGPADLSKSLVRNASRGGSTVELNGDVISRSSSLTFGLFLLLLALLKR